MVKHRLGDVVCGLHRAQGDEERGFLSLASKPVVSGLTLKTGSYGLVIQASKSPRRILGLGLKTKRAMICQ
jgi:hypothetical protein